MRGRAAVAILGNHDVAAIDGYGVEYFNPNARVAIAYTQGVLEPEARAWLDSLGYEHRSPDFLLVHGAPVDYFTYILEKRAAARAFAATDARLIFVGHSHVAEYYRLLPDGTIAHAHMQRGGALDLDPASRYVINAGSVGQPRDLNPAASFALYDQAAGRVTWERVPYAIAAAQAKIAQAGLPPQLAARLGEGR